MKRKGGHQRSGNRKKKPHWDVYEDEEAKDSREHRLEAFGSGESEYVKDVIPEEDDEEIDEDMAFDDEDEEKFGEFFAKESSGGEEEDDEVAGFFNSEQEEEDDEGEEMTFFDDNEEDESTGKKTFKALLPAEEEEEDEQMPSDLSQDEEGDEDEFDVLGLVDSLSSIPSKNKKDVKKKREVSEAYPESEFNLSGVPKTSQAKVDLNDLVGALKNETSFGGLKKQLHNLEEKTEAVAVPLPVRTKDRLDRTAAYQETKKQVSRWQNIVKKNREADHVTFTTNDPVAQNHSTGSLVSRFQPKTEMEKEIQGILQSNNLSEKEIQQQEELQLNKLSKEELMARRAELQKMRSLLFYHELKQKKISKIKSKAYRKRHRKPSEGDEPLTADDLKKMSPEEAREALMKIEAKRAEERMSLKHKNTGKWAKRIMGRGEVDEETRQALMNQLKQHDELKRKITGYDSDEVASSSEGGDVVLETIQDMEQDLEQTEVPQKGLFAMKFMQRAVEGQKNKTKQELAKLRDDYERMEKVLDDDVSNSENELEEEDEEEMQFGGRRTHGKTAMEGAVNEELEQEYYEKYKKSMGTGDFSEPSLVMESTGAVGIDQGSVLVEAKRQVHVTGTVNADISSSESDSEIEPINSEHQEAEESSDGEEQGQEEQEEEEEEEGNPWLTISSTAPLQKSTKLHKETGREAKALAKLQKAKGIASEAEPVGDSILQQHQDESSEDSELETENEVVPLSHMSRKDVLSLAFANDNLFEEFEKEQEEFLNPTETEDQQDTMPGWGGGWSGPGVEQKKKKSLPKEEEKKKKTDKKKVIINHKAAKIQGKYMVEKVPHGFANKEHYDRSRRMPLGKEWNTVQTFQKQIKPRVSVKPGQLIEPMSWTGSRSKKD